MFLRSIAGALLCALISSCSLAPALAGTVRSKSGATAHVAASAVPAFQCIVDRLDAQGYPIRFMGGHRARGSVRGSLHPAGLAIDINQVARNRTVPPMPRNEIEIANSCGAISGAQWRRGDSGHFQIGGWAGHRRHIAKRSRVEPIQQAAVWD